jgi:hypothetical protein
MRFLDSVLFQVLTSFRVTLDIVQRIIERHSSPHRKHLDFFSGLKSQHPTYLRAAQYSPSVTLYRQRLQRIPGRITPLLFQVVLNVLGYFNFAAT